MFFFVFIFYGLLILLIVFEFGLVVFDGDVVRIEFMWVVDGFSGRN